MAYKFLSDWLRRKSSEEASPYVIALPSSRVRS